MAMSPAMKRTGCLILPPAFWKMLFVFLATLLDEAQKKRVSTNNRMGLSWLFHVTSFRHLFNPATWKQKNLFWWLPIAPRTKKNSRKSEENPSGSQFRFKPQSYRAPTWGLYIKVATTQIGIPLTPKDLTSFRGPNIWRY